MSKQPNVKILVGYHKPAPLLKSDVLVPIHLGRVLATEASKDGKMSDEDYQWMLDNMIGDDTGDNISHKNLYLNELSALYWAWKNYEQLGNPDYFGFMHYRRHLCFDEQNKEIPDQYGLLYSDDLNDEYIEKYKLKDKNMLPIIGDNDIVVAEKTDLCILGTNNVYDHYKFSDPKLHIKDLDIVMDILLESYPDYRVAKNKYLNSKFAYFTNVFVMKKDIFFEYCSWLFDIIFKAQKTIDLNQYNIQEMRSLAYIAEWLFGIFLTQKKDTQNIKVQELKRTFINNTDITVDIKNENPSDIPIVFATDNNYAPYLGVAIKSLVEHASKQNSYRIFVLNECLNSIIKNKLELLQTNNVKIYFIDISNYLKQHKDILFIRDHFSLAIYNRLFIPIIFKNFEKIVYCDCDAVFLDDVANIYNIDIRGYMLGAVKDTEVCREIYCEHDGYFTDTLKIDQPLNYFNSGILSMNIKLLKDCNFVENVLGILKGLNSPRFPDQDVLNIFCEGQVKFFDGSWNVENHLKIWRKNLINELPYPIYLKYEKNLREAKFLHYTGALKPWQDPCCYNAYIWWHYARMTPFYEEILYKNFPQLLQQHTAPVISKEMFGEALNYIKNKHKYWRYKILSKVTFGEKRKRYKQKRKNLKARLKEVRRFLKGK